MRNRQQRAGGLPAADDHANGESRGSDSAAALVRTAKQKAKEGKDAEAVQRAALCPSEKSDQDAVKRDGAAVLQFLKEK